MRLTFGTAHAVKPACNTSLNAKHRSAAKPTLAELAWLEHDSYLVRLVGSVAYQIQKTTGRSDSEGHDQEFRIIEMSHECRLLDNSLTIDRF